VFLVTLQLYTVDWCRPGHRPFAAGRPM